MSRRLCFGCGNRHEGIKSVTWGTTVPGGRTGCLRWSATYKGLVSEDKAVSFKATHGLGQILEAFDSRPRFGVR